MASLVADTLVQVNKKNKREESDDPFDSVTFIESIARERGYLQGLQEGREESATRGFIVGFNTASSISWDLGYARSFTATLMIEPTTLTPFGRKLCEDIILKVDKFPRTNVESEDLVGVVKDIKASIDKIKTVVLKQPIPEDGLTQKYSL